LIECGKRLSLSLTIMAIVPLLNTCADAAPMLEYSQDNVHFKSLALIIGAKSANQYYDLRGGSGHPAFGTLAGTTSTAFYWDTTRDILSTIDISGTTSIDAGKVNLTFAGLPRGTIATLVQDSVSLRLNRQRARATIEYVHETGGLVLGNLGQLPFQIEMTLSAAKPLNHWRLSSGLGKFVQLNPSEPLYIDSLAQPTARQRHSGTTRGGQPGVQLPEPAGMLLLAATSILMMRRCRGNRAENRQAGNG
jgi:hypothetical protein